ncbi:hypothetical protein BC831DRAFT_441468, partial [Entophlyctis helioformis]
MLMLDGLAWTACCRLGRACTSCRPTRRLPPFCCPSAVVCINGLGLERRDPCRM